MGRPVYFDTSTFIEIQAKASKHAATIRDLLKELKDGNHRIYTSILTVQEASVLSYRRGKVAYDNHAAIAKLSRIWGIDVRIALTAAKREAEIRDMCHDKPEESEMKQRRRWDCIHIATAQVLECTHLFTTDAGMIKRQRQLGIADLEIGLPTPRVPTLNFPPLVTIVKQNP